MKTLVVEIFLKCGIYRLKLLSFNCSSDFFRGAGVESGCVARLDSWAQAVLCLRLRVPSPCVGVLSWAGTQDHRPCLLFAFFGHCVCANLVSQICGFRVPIPLEKLRTKLKLCI